MAIYPQQISGTKRLLNRYLKHQIISKTVIVFRLIVIVIVWIARFCET